MTTISQEKKLPGQNRSFADKRLIWILIVTALAVSFSFQGSRGLFETSEGRYAECAREMIESGNYIEPTLNYTPHWTKPPLTYWAIALGHLMIGHGEWGLRFFHAVAFFLCTLAVVWIGRAIWDSRTGIIAGFIYATSIFPAAGAFSLTTDMLLAFWEIYAVLCFIKACETPSPGTQKGWILAMYACLGFGFLTKGPPSLIPLIPILLWRLRTKRPAGLASPTGLFLFIATGLSWYLLIIFLHPELLSYFIGTEIIDRFASNAVHNHEWFGPIKIYGPVLLLGGGIWSIYGIRFLLKKKFLNPRSLWKHLKESRYEFFLVAWIIPALFIFILVKSRLHLYLLPLHAPITLLIARGFSAGFQREHNMARIVRTALISAIFLIALKGASAYFPSGHDMKALYHFCREVGGKNTSVAVYNDARLYGLQYYLSGRLDRVNSSNVKEWLEAADDIFKHGGENEALDDARLIVSKRKYSDALARILNDSFQPYIRHEYRGWILFILQRERASS